MPTCQVIYCQKSVTDNNTYCKKHRKCIKNGCQNTRFDAYHDKCGQHEWQTCCSNGCRGKIVSGQDKYGKPYTYCKSCKCKSEGCQAYSRLDDRHGYCSKCRFEKNSGEIKNINEM